LWRKTLSIDILELSMLRALEKEGIEVVDSQQAMLDAREIKTGVSWVFIGVSS